MSKGGSSKTVSSLLIITIMSEKLRKGVIDLLVGRDRQSDQHKKNKQEKRQGFWIMHQMYFFYII